MRKFLVCTLLLFPGAALANPQCTDEPRSAWLSEAAMRDKITSSGHKIEVFKITKGNCYEIYGRTPAGKRVEIYYHPINGDVVKQSAR